jgi:hypothetical protein
MKTRNRLNDVAEQHKERVGVARVLDCQLLGVLHLFQQERCGQVTTVREVSI